MFNRFRQWGKDFAPLGGYADTINWLYDSRKAARYLTADKVFRTKELEDHFEVVGKMLQELRDRIGPDIQAAAFSPPPAAKTP